MHQSKMTLVGVLALGSAWIVVERLRSSDPDTQTPPAGASSRDREDPQPQHDDERHSNTNSNTRLESPPHEPPEDALSEAWDGMPRAERIDALVEELQAAMQQLRDGSDIEHNLRVANDALSVLRSDMYASQAGRSRHAELEDELDTIVAWLDVGTPRGAEMAR